MKDSPWSSRPISLAVCEFLNESLISQYIGWGPSQRCLHFDVVGGLEWSNDPESNANGSIATGRVSYAGKVKGDVPD